MAGKSFRNISLQLVFSDTRYKNLHKIKMAATMRYAAALVILAIICFIEISEANYKNAPMNGIMFGKRGASDYDNRGKAFTALCEIATEACQTWFPSPENK